MPEDITPTPHEPVKGGVVPYLTLDGAVAAARFYEHALGAQIMSMVEPDAEGRTMHIHLYLNGSSIMLSDAYPDHGHPYRPMQGATLMMMVNDIQAAYQRAVDAGCEATLRPEKMFWGDTYGEFRCPYGVSWSMNQPG